MHTTHTAQPVYLYPWVDIPAYRLLVTAPSAQHNTTQHNTTQHNTTQHNTTQHNTTQHNTTQHNTTQHNTTQHNTTQHNTTQHNTTQHNTTQHNTTQHNTTQHNTTQHNTTQHNTTQHNTTQHTTTQHKTLRRQWDALRRHCIPPKTSLLRHGQSGQCATGPFFVLSLLMDCSFHLHNFLQLGSLCTRTTIRKNLGK